jgi:proline racemase
MQTVRTIDAHAEGGPLRLVVDGFPAPKGRTMADKVEWLRRHDDRRRRLLMREPRGHSGIGGAILTEPTSPGSHAGVIFMNGGGYPPLVGHGLIAITTIALERGLLMPGGDDLTVVYDTPAGTVRTRAQRNGHRVTRVTVVNVPSFVVQGGVPVKALGRQLRVDVAFAGALYAIVDSESIGLAVDARHVPQLRDAGIEMARSAASVQPWSHPATGRIEELHGTIFTAPARGNADLRNVMVRADGYVDRSPGVTGTAAVMAVLDAMGLLSEDRPFVHEGLVDTRLEGRVAARTTIGEIPGIVAEIDGTAWITGEHIFLSDPQDPLAEGFAL